MESEKLITELKAAISDLKDIIGGLTPINNSEMMRLKDWAKLRGISYQTAWNYVKAGKIKAERIGSMWYVVSDKEID